MTCTEWNNALEFLSVATVGQWVENNNRLVVIEDMCGGRYLLYEDHEVVGLTDNIITALCFLRG